MADFTSVCSLELENQRELVLVIHKLKNRSRDVNPVYILQPGVVVRKKWSLSLPPILA